MKHPAVPKASVGGSIRRPLRRGPISQRLPGPASPDDERPRQKPLPACPSLRCRRAKACLAAHDNLYCQRTHFSPAVAEKWLRRDPRRRELDAVPPVMDPDSLSERMERINELAAIEGRKPPKMTARWKAGEFDALYGPYGARGVLLRPPPKTYVEGPAKAGAKGAGLGRAGDV